MFSNMTRPGHWPLGHAFDSPEIQSVISGWEELEWLDDEALEKARVDRRLSLINRELGLYLFFTTAECYTRRYGMPRTPGWLVLARVVFMLDSADGFTAFTGPMPMGLAAADTFASISQRLSRPVRTWSAGDTVHKARWLTDELDVDVSFTGNGHGIKLISVTPERVARLADAPSPEIPEPARLVELFGTPLSQLQAMPELAAFGLAERAEEIAHYDEADCTREFGMELYFKPGGEIDRDVYPGPDTSQPCLSGVRYRVDLDFASVRYPGALPGQLDFDDPPPVVVAKLGGPPVKQSMDGTDGYQRWRLARTDLHVLYSLLEDRIYRVTLLAHGCYE